jgi:hypothetical protein
LHSVANGNLIDPLTNTPVLIGATLGAGASWEWTPNISGSNKTAIRVVATDGLLDSATPIPVKVDVL